MATMEDPIEGIELDDDRYTVVQSLVRNKYKAMDAAGDVVLRGKQKLFRMKEEFPFTDADGEPVFTVTAGGILDVAGDYTLKDEATDEPVVVLDNQWKFISDHWKLRDPDTEALVAEIKSKSAFIMFLRHLPYVGPLFGILPHKYEITDVDGDHVGSIEGQFALKDKYDIEIDDASDVPKEAVVAGAMVIDAIEGN